MANSSKGRFALVFRVRFTEDDDSEVARARFVLREVSAGLDSLSRLGARFRATCGLGSANGFTAVLAARDRCEDLNDCRRATGCASSGASSPWFEYCSATESSGS